MGNYMVTFTTEQRQQLQTYVSEYTTWFMNWVFLPVRGALGNLAPYRLKSMVDALIDLSNRLYNEKDFSLKSDDANLIKRVLVFQQNHVAEKQEEIRLINRDTDTFQQIEDLMKPIDEFLQQDWLRNVQPASLPKLTDYLTLEAAYKQLKPIVKDKLNIDLVSSVDQYDEKFGILQAPRSFLSQLRICRLEAALRDIETTIAFIDIDNFKEFNSLYTETRVDRDVLPYIMRALEAHIFSRGAAFRFGGDEYMLLLPNTSSEEAITSLLRLQKKLEELRMVDVSKKITISIGLCTISSDSSLTDREVKQLANNAKEHAKKKGGKNCIAYYKGKLYGEADLDITRNS